MPIINIINKFIELNWTKSTATSMATAVAAALPSSNNNGNNNGYNNLAIISAISCRHHSPPLLPLEKA